MLVGAVEVKVAEKEKEDHVVAGVSTVPIDVVPDMCVRGGMMAFSGIPPLPSSDFPPSPPHPCPGHSSRWPPSSSLWVSAAGIRRPIAVVVLRLLLLLPSPVVVVAEDAAEAVESRYTVNPTCEFSDDRHEEGSAEPVPRMVDTVELEGVRSSPLGPLLRSPLDVGLVHPVVSHDTAGQTPDEVEKICRYKEEDVDGRGGKEGGSIDDRIEEEAMLGVFVVVVVVALVIVACITINEALVGNVREEVVPHVADVSSGAAGALILLGSPSVCASTACESMCFLSDGKHVTVTGRAGEARGEVGK